MDAGLRASLLTTLLGVATDPLGRLDVDEALRVRDVEDVFAAGDVARAMADRDRVTVMSCQHAVPMGKVAGHNVAADLVGTELLRYEQPEYVTCLDLGAAGAVFTRGWERTVAATGPAAKRLKEQINHRDLIYPPLSGDRAELLDAARLDDAVAPALS